MARLPRLAGVGDHADPGHDFELAAGYLLHEGLVGPGDLRTVAYCTDEDLSDEEEFNVVTVTLERPPRRDPGHRHVGSSSGSSACGVCGKDSVSDVLDLARGERWAGPAVHADLVRALPERLRPAQAVFERTGGVHAAGLFTASGELLVAREDVGRHNAVDKVTGARLLAGAPVSDACLVVSGRAGFELVQKAVATGTGALAAVGVPSSLSVRLAAESGLALYGWVSGRRCVRYA